MKTSLNGKYAIVYKILTSNNESFAILDARLKLKYKIGVWMLPRIGRLFAFEDYDSAKQLHLLRGEKIYKSLALISELQYKAFPTHYSSVITYFWLDEDFRKMYQPTFAAPPKGTILCDKIKLLYRVNNC